MIFFIFLFLLLLFADFSLGKSTMVLTKLRIPSPVSVNLTIFIDGKNCPASPFKYCPLETINITTEVKNTGTENITGNLSTLVIYSNQTKKEETWKEIQLNDDESLNFSTNYTVQPVDEEGIYEIVSNFTLDNNFTSATCSFKVKKGIGTLYASPGIIKDSIQAGTSKEYNLTLWLVDACNSTFASMNSSVDPLEVFFSPEKIFLNSSGKANRTTALIAVSPSTPPGIYDDGTITAMADNKTVLIHLNITVLPLPETTSIPSAGGRAPSMPSIISNASMSLKLSTHALSVIAGGDTSFLAYVNNTGNKDLKGVRILIQGIPLKWLSIDPSFTDIQKGKSQVYSVKIRVPSDAIGVYDLRIIASNEVKSNEESLTLVVGKNYKEICDLLLKEIDKVKSEAERALLIEECLDITPMKALHEDANLALKNGKLEYQRENYEKAIDWLEYALPQEKKVINKADMIILLELSSSNRSKSIIPPFFDAEKQFTLAENYFEAKNYEEICKPIERIRGYIVNGLIFWPSAFISLVVIIILMIVIRMKKVEREKVMKKIRERLGVSETRLNQ